MLGEPIGEARGQITNFRVLSGDGAPKVEVSFQSTGTLLGVACTEMGTYVSTMRPDGTMFGNGQGILTTTDGEGITWTGQGLGKRKGSGMAASWRGAIYYQTASRNLARLNGMVALFEYDTDGDGKTHSKMWEWK